MGCADEDWESYLLIEGTDSIDTEIIGTLLEETGATVETVASLTAAAKKLHSNSYTCTIIFANRSTSLTHLKESVDDQPIVVLHDGSSLPSSDWINLDDTTYILQWNTDTLQQTVTHIRNLVMKIEAKDNLDQYSQLETAIRRILSSIQTAESREELETKVCEWLISSNLYIAAWSSIYDDATDTLTPHTAAGIDACYLTSPSPHIRSTEEVQVDGHSKSRYTITIPLHCETRFVGTLSLTTSRNIDDAEQDLLQELGDDVARAIQTVEAQSHNVGAESALDVYTQSFSHELRNHLQTARAELQAARDDEESFDRVFDILDRIERLDREAVLLTQQSIDDDLLSVHSLSAIVLEVQTRMPQVAEQVEICESKPILAYRPLVELLLENLFRNSLNHAGPTAKICVGAIEDGFFVEDTGDGLSDIPLHSLFEWGTSENGDSGIGLAIVKRITDLHGWDITATDPPDKGLRFEISSVTTDHQLVTFEHDPNPSSTDK